MAWGARTHRGSGNNKTSGTTISVSPTANLPVGAVIIVRCVSDNSATVPQGSSTFHNVTDSKGNSWTKLGEGCRTPLQEDGDGVIASLWWSKLATAILTTDSITLTLDLAVVAKAIGIEETSVASGATITQFAAALAFGASTTPSVSKSGLTSQEYLWVGHIGIEGPNGDTFTQDADYADNTSFGTTGGAAASNVASRCGYRVFTGTSDTYNPTLGTARDWVALLGALREIPGGILLEAAISVAGTAVAALTTAIEMAGAISGAGTIVAALTTEITLAGQISASGLVAGALTTEIRLVALASGAGTVIADLTAPQQNLFEAVISTSGMVVAPLTTEILLVGAVSGSGSLVGSLTTEITLVGAISASGQVVASLTTEITLAAQVEGSGSLAASLTTEITLVAQIAGAGSIVADLTTQITLTGVISASGIVAGTLTTEIQLQAVIAGAGTVAANLSTAIQFVALVESAGNVIADLTAGAVIQLAAILDAEAFLEGNLYLILGPYFDKDGQATVAGTDGKTLALGLSGETKAE